MHVQDFSIRSASAYLVLLFRGGSGKTCPRRDKGRRLPLQTEGRFVLCVSLKNKTQRKCRFEKAKAIKNISIIHGDTVNAGNTCDITFRRQPSGFGNCFHTLRGMSNISLVHDAHTMHI